MRDVFEFSSTPVHAGMDLSFDVVELSGLECASLYLTFSLYRKNELSSKENPIHFPCS